jgi:GNAT superfamily N-acetyltransferase
MAIRTLSPSTSEATWEELTALLHRAYRAQVEMGLRPLAGRQSAEVTRRRCLAGETFVADAASSAEPRPESQPGIVGMIVFQEIEEAAFPVWFLRPDVAHFSLFAVEPQLQGKGVGAALLAAVERRASALGFGELALSMAEPDAALLDYYRRRGFRFVQHWRWPYTNYRSVILSRALNVLPMP